MLCIEVRIIACNQYSCGKVTPKVSENEFIEKKSCETKEGQIKCRRKRRIIMDETEQTIIETISIDWYLNGNLMPNRGLH